MIFGCIIASSVSVYKCNIHYCGYNLNIEKDLKQKIAIKCCFKLGKIANSSIVSFYPACIIIKIAVLKIQIQNNDDCIF